MRKSLSEEDLQEEERHRQELEAQEALRQAQEERHRRETEAQEAFQAALEYASQTTLNKSMPARAILSIGGDYTIGPVSLGINVHNLLDTVFYRSGMNTNVIPQQSRWFMVSVGIKL